MPEMPQRIFATVSEALSALSRDRLASVWFRAGSVFVATAHGTGTFTAEEWEKAGGPKNSMTTEDEGPVTA